MGLWLAYLDSTSHRPSYTIRGVGVDRLVVIVITLWDQFRGQKPWVVYRLQISKWVTQDDDNYVSAIRPHAFHWQKSFTMPGSTVESAVSYPSVEYKHYTVQRRKKTYLRAYMVWNFAPSKL